MRLRRRGNLAILLIILLITVALAIQFSAGAWQPESLSIKELADELNRGNIRRLVVDETEVQVIFTDGSSAIAPKEASRTLFQQLLELDIPEEMLLSDGLQIEVRQAGLMSTSRLVPLLVAAIVGMALGAAMMLLVVRVRYLR